MKKFTLLIVSCLICFALASCQKTEPESECKLKDFPYEIFEVKKMKLYIASEKYHHPDLDCSEEELYASDYYYINNGKNIFHPAGRNRRLLRKE